MSTKLSECLDLEGGRFLVLGMPVGTEIGIDMNVFRVGPRFQGLRGIPPGLHFIFYSAVGRHCQGSAPRTGFFHYFSSGEVVARKWDQQKEDMEEFSPTEDQLKNCKENEEKHLGLYPYQTWRQWISLSDHLTWDLVQRLRPENGIISAATQLMPLVYPLPQDEILDDHEPVTSVQRGSRLMKRSLEDDLLPQMKPLPGTEIHFTSLPERSSYPEGSTPSEISQHSMDYSYTLDQLLEKESKNLPDVLGELQFSFICFLVGGVYEAFDQWRKWLHLLASCERAIGQHPLFFSNMMGVLHFQLREVPADFFVDIVEAENFLCSSLSKFFINLSQSGSAPGDLKAKGRRFQKSLTKSFRWRFDEEDDAPVIVIFDDVPPTTGDLEVEQ